MFSASNVTLSLCSTAGGQSLSVGVPHAYVIGSSDASHGCRDVFTDGDSSNTPLIPNVLDDDALADTIGKVFRKEGYNVDVAKGTCYRLQHEQGACRWDIHTNLNVLYIEWMGHSYRPDQYLNVQYSQ